MADSIEGYLFPDTYIFNRSMSTRQIMKIMVSQFWKKVTPEMVKRAEELGFNTHQFVTFASIVGKESGDDAEKPLISAVFHNRLKKKMRLQSDPTAVYDLENFDGKVLQQSFEKKFTLQHLYYQRLAAWPYCQSRMDFFKCRAVSCFC